MSELFHEAVREAVSVKRFGAKLNGDDDTAAIQLAIQEAIAGDIEVYIPGTAAVRQLFIEGHNVTIRGAGASASLLWQLPGTNADMVVVGNGSSYVSHARIEHLMLRGDSASGVKSFGAERTVIAHCHIAGFQYGVRSIGTAARQDIYLEVLHSYINGNKAHGIFSGEHSYSVGVTGGVIAGNGKNPAGGAGFYAEGNDTHRLSGVLFDENEHGIVLYNCSDVAINGCVLENQDRHGILCHGGGGSHAINGNVILNPSQEVPETYSGVVLDGVTYCSVVGNAIRGPAVRMSDGVREIGSANWNVIGLNTIQNAVNPILTVGPNTRVA